MDEIYQTIYGHDAFQVVISAYTEHPFIDEETGAVNIYTDMFKAKQRINYLSLSGYKVKLKELKNCYEEFTELCRSIGAVSVELNGGDFDAEPTVATLDEMYEWVTERGDQYWVDMNRDALRSILTTLQSGRRQVSRERMDELLKDVNYAVPVDIAHSDSDHTVFPPMKSIGFAPVFFNRYSLVNYIRARSFVESNFDCYILTRSELEELVYRTGVSFMLDPGHVHYFLIGPKSEEETL